MRHKRALEKAKDHLSLFIGAIKQDKQSEIISIELRLII